MIAEQNIRAIAREVAQEFVGRNVRDTESLLSSGLIDSLTVVRLITRLEERLGVKIPAQTLQPDDFDSVELMVETIARVAVQK